MERSSAHNEKISIKNLLFTKAIPNYTLPVCPDGHQIFPCTDCGDRFIIKSSYEYHINRKSLKISYVCRHCNEEKIFYNRCNLLSHIRSHVFKTATINISDIKIEPLPLTDLNYQNETNCENEVLLPTPSTNTQLNPKSQDVTTELQNEDYTPGTLICFDCKKNIYKTGIFYKDRERHYMEYTNSIYSCPICLMSLFTQCGLKAHIRLHLKEPPYYCPECGIHLGNKTLVYPYSHDCESFKMMRVTAKLMCLVKDCSKIFHPNGSAKHIRNSHLKKVYKCSICSVACYKLSNMLKHFKTHKARLLKVLEFFQCEMCPGRLVIPNQIERHLKTHGSRIVHDVYPCWTCGATFKLAKSLIQHQIVIHQDLDLKNIYGQIVHEPTGSIPYYNLKTRSCDSINKKCDKCLSNFISRHSTNKNGVVIQRPCSCKKNVMPHAHIVCHICKLRVILDWAMIKKHYAIYHKEHKCMDAKVIIKRLDIKKYQKDNLTTNKQNKVRPPNKTIDDMTRFSTPENNVPISIAHGNNFICNKCGKEYENKLLLETHIITHKDPFMAYQCMECAESFIVKRSFSTHLLLNHGINNVDDYINQKKCYTEGSLHANTKNPNNFEQTAPVNENQCNICREQFSDSTEFKKHFRVHGMAFLKKNSNMAVSPDKQ